MAHDVGLTAKSNAAWIVPAPSMPDPLLKMVDPCDITDGLSDVTMMPPGSKDDVTFMPPTSGVDVTPTASAARRRGLLGERDFRQLFIADSGSQLGTQIGMLALPLVAAVTLHAAAFEMAW